MAALLCGEEFKVQMFSLFLLVGPLLALLPARPFFRCRRPRQSRGNRRGRRLYIFLVPKLLLGNGIFLPKLCLGTVL